MLAIELHKSPPLFWAWAVIWSQSCLGAGERFVRNWVPMLNRQNRHRPNNQIHCITLVRVQDSTRLTLRPPMDGRNRRE